MSINHQQSLVKMLTLMVCAEAEFEEVDAIEMVLKAKPKVDAADGKKMTALHVGAGKGNLEILQILVRI